MAVLTNKYYIDTVSNFVNGIQNETNSYYVFIGKPDPWLNSIGEIVDSSPPPATPTINEAELTVYNDMVYAKQITNLDVSYMLPRYDWTSNTVYSYYDQNDPNLFTKNFYTVNDKYEVYKCIFNNYGAPSTVKPEVPTTSGTFNTSDGYVWKYMYTITSDANTRFSSQNYIPVTPNNYVIANAIPGTIDYIRVDSSGSGYDTYTSGYLTAYVNTYVVQLQSDASAYNNFYSNSSIYLKAGFGSGQIREIRSYNGLTKQIITTTPFDVFEYMNIGNIQGLENIEIGLEVAQRFDSLGINYLKGFFNPGDTVLQSDTGATATIATSNSTILNTVKYSTNNFAQNLPIYNTSQAGVLKNGTVSITSGNTFINAYSGTSFKTDYAINDYILVGSNTAANIRRVVGVNNSVITVDTPFNTSLTANVHYSLPFAANPSSVTILNANGYVSSLNLSGIQMTIANLTNLGISYTVGENVRMVDVNNVDQLANGVVVYSNTSSLVLDNVQGTFSTGLFVYGVTSLQKAQISIVTETPSIIIQNPSGMFITGQEIFFRPPQDLTQTQQVANATLLSSYITPNELTEYIISPTVTITGDGEGAIAYSDVNPSTNVISGITIINPGSNYTFANVAITANAYHGNGAAVSALISPLNGHGYDAIQELSARYASISVPFDNLENESYVFPPYGQYRKIGIIEQPLFDNVVIDVTSFDRAKLTIANKSGDFVPGEVVVQANSNGVGVVVFSNSTYIEIKNVGSNNSSWVANTTGDEIYGYTSAATANVKVFNTSYFTHGSTLETISETNSGGSAQITQIINTNTTNQQIRLTNVSGKFDINDIVYEPATNAYAVVDAIYESNGSIDVSSSFGQRLVQTARVPLSSHYGIFQKFEYVTQNISGATGKIISTSDELDIVYTDPSGSFNIGDTITSQNTSSTGIVTFANTTYLQLTALSGAMYSGDTIINNYGVTATAISISQVLVLSDVSGTNKFQTGNYNITGNTSGAFGISTAVGAILYPNLVKESGTVLYFENVIPFERSNTSKEQVSLVIKF
jgi:hypothetical protein